MTAVKRDYLFDNIKCLLIILVVAGHIIENIDNSTVNYIYKIIYSFHMPAFIFVTGYFARFRPEKILRKIVLPYIVFQTLYILFDYFVLHQADTFNLQYTKPYWIMWYLMATLFYHMIIPFIEYDSNNKRIIVIVISVMISLLAGYNNSIGYFLSVSRICVFMPFFILGYYASKSDISAKICQLKTPVKAALIILSAIACFLGTLFVKQDIITRNILYCSYGYEKTGSNPMIRLACMIIALFWICLLTLIIPKKKVTIISWVGSKTFWIYVLHGFIVRYFFG